MYSESAANPPEPSNFLRFCSHSWASWAAVSILRSNLALYFLNLKLTMPELCAHKPCKCLVETDEIFCSEVCAMLGASLVNRVDVSTSLPLEPDDRVVARCACGHSGCGDSQVSARIN